MSSRSWRCPPATGRVTAGDAAARCEIGVGDQALHVPVARRDGTYRRGPSRRPHPRPAARREPRSGRAWARSPSRALPATGPGCPRLPPWGHAAVPRGPPSPIRMPTSTPTGSSDRSRGPGSEAPPAGTRPVLQLRRRAPRAAPGSGDRAGLRADPHDPGRDAARPRVDLVRRHPPAPGPPPRQAGGAVAPGDGGRRGPARERRGPAPIPRARP